MAATRNGIKSLICMPDGAPISKVEATKQLGAEVRLVKGAYDDAYATALQIQEETGATFIHPFDDPEVIAGQGTIGLEILDELEDPDAVVVPIGGGGLISGVAYAIKHLNPKVKVYGVQAAGAASMVESQKAGEPIMLDRADTFADGIAVKHPGDLTYELVKEYVDEIVTVTEDEISTAILALLEKQKVIAEGAGAVPVAGHRGRLPAAVCPRAVGSGPGGGRSSRAVRRLCRHVGGDRCGQHHAGGGHHGGQPEPLLRGAGGGTGKPGGSLPLPR